MWTGWTREPNSPSWLAPACKCRLSIQHCLRFVVKDEPGIIAALAQILCQAGINIDSVFQKPGFPKSKLPFVITLEPCSAALVRESLKQIAQLDFLVQPCVDLPILD